VGNDDRPFFGGFQILRKIGSDLTLSCKFHNFTSLPATSNRFPSLTPMAWICTSPCSSSMPYSTRKRLSFSKIGAALSNLQLPSARRHPTDFHARGAGEWLNDCRGDFQILMLVQYPFRGIF